MNFVLIPVIIALFVLGSMMPADHAIRYHR